MQVPQWAGRQKHVQQACSFGNLFLWHKLQRMFLFTCAESAWCISIFFHPPIFLFFCFFFFLESISIPFLLLWVEIWSSVLSLCIFEVGFLVLRHHEAVQHKQPFYRSPGPEVRLLLLLRRSSQPLLRALGSLLLAVPTSSCVISQPASPVEEA